ncbi:MAG TPA: hypothetical protein PLS71_04555 [Leptospiraceae bacterium]|nr:hypothetical protein [Leptospiraceae bacterium]HNB97486.1 hypothetical protein [Leptospiraceae bacterium]HNE06883.1 hypothetical protein [Leptospiraceae bacterium]HNG98820.1 hypothetical protein [Leptospiraceae bacterium]HNI86544.1 hypothetical protein [Leptospiraceae bacterium]
MKLTVSIFLILFFHFISCATLSNDENIESSNHWSDYQGELNWEDAKRKCGSLGLAGYGMRLPSIDELEIAYKKGITKSWKSDWQQTKNSGYWTANHYSEARAYYFLVELGELDYLNKKDIKHVRCKR